jgi:hypothetical protein
MSKKTTWHTIDSAQDFEYRHGFQNIMGDRRKVTKFRHKPTGIEAYTFFGSYCGDNVMAGQDHAFHYMFGHKFMNDHIYEKETAQ